MGGSGRVLAVLTELFGVWGHSSGWMGIAWVLGVPSDVGKKTAVRISLL
jgi:hypothetical protein